MGFHYSISPLLFRSGNRANTRFCFYNWLCVSDTSKQSVCASGPDLSLSSIAQSYFRLFLFFTKEKRQSLGCVTKSVLGNTERIIPLLDGWMYFTGIRHPPVNRRQQISHATGTSTPSPARFLIAYIPTVPQWTASNSTASQTFHASTCTSHQRRVGKLLTNKECWGCLRRGDRGLFRAHKLVIHTSMLRALYGH